MNILSLSLLIVLLSIANSGWMQMPKACIAEGDHCEDSDPGTKMCCGLTRCLDKLKKGWLCERDWSAEEAGEAHESGMDNYYNYQVDIEQMEEDALRKEKYRKRKAMKRLIKKYKSDSESH